MAVSMMALSCGGCRGGQLVHGFYCTASKVLVLPPCGVSKCKDEKVSCVLIGAVWPRQLANQTKFLSMPVKAVQAELCLPGSNVRRARACQKHSRYRMQAWYSVW